MIQFSTQGGYLLLVTQGGPRGGGTYLRQGVYLGQGACFFFDKQTNVQNKTLIFISKGTIPETVTVTNIQ